MAAVVLGADNMGPERIFPNQTEELGPHQGPTEGTGDWSSEEPEEEQEEPGAGPAGYSYQPLNQDPEPEEVELAPVGDGEDVVADIQDRIQALGLHLPDPPLESEDEDEEGATALSSHSSIPMDPVSACDFRTCRAGEKDNGWSKLACTRGSCLGSGDIRCPVG
uniref:Male-enhanced antigen 1 n=1 Tax=Myotis myotis TaxID=51298 RepID=A0A7J7WW19_MYOMY|nr:male-enhanced antigen 1 [Myotis myotis]